MQEKVDIWKKPTQSHYFETENKKRFLTISTHFKTTKTVVENGYF